jgi:hypothetical protein
VFLLCHRRHFKICLYYMMMRKVCVLGSHAIPGTLQACFCYTRAGHFIPQQYSYKHCAFHFCRLATFSFEFGTSTKLHIGELMMCFNEACSKVCDSFCDMFPIENGLKTEVFYHHCFWPCHSSGSYCWIPTAAA